MGFYALVCESNIDNMGVYTTLPWISRFVSYFSFRSFSSSFPLAGLSRSMQWKVLTFCTIWIWWCWSGKIEYGKFNTLLYAYHFLWNMLCPQCLHVSKIYFALPAYFVILENGYLGLDKVCNFSVSKVCEPWMKSIYPLKPVAGSSGRGVISPL